METTADLMADLLVQTGVERIYGVVRDSLNAFTDALRRLKEIQWVHVRHEEGAALAAGAEAHLTGKLAVCAGSCGPGNLHLINGLFDCHRSGVPVLAIASLKPVISGRRDIGNGGCKSLVRVRRRSRRASVPKWPRASGHLRRA